MNLNDSSPLGEENITEPNKEVSTSEFEKLTDLTNTLTDSVDLLERQTAYLQARENGTNKQILSYEQVIEDSAKTNQRLNSELAKSQKLNEDLISQNEILRDRNIKYSTVFWVAILMVCIITVFVMRVVHVFQERGKVFWLVEYLRSLWPFRTAPPDPDDVSFKLTGREGKSYGWVFGIVFVIIISIVIITLMKGSP